MSLAVANELLQNREEVTDLLSRAIDFLENTKGADGDFKYRNRIRDAILRGENSIVIDFIDLINYDEDLATRLVEDPEYMIENVFKPALIEFARSIFIAFEKKTLTPRFRGLIETVPIRDLRTEHLGKLVQVEGVVLKLTPPKQRIQKATFLHAYPECNSKFSIEVSSEIVKRPSSCGVCGGSAGSFELIEEESEFIDYQKIVISEMPEEVPSGRMPRQITIILEGELVDRVRPGDKAIVVGILRLAKDKGGSSRRFKGVYESEIYANYIEAGRKGVDEITLTEEDIEEIKKLGRDPLIRRKIIASIAPTIYGHWDIKEAIALALFGGIPKIRRDGTRIRGDIHVLLIGDPGTAKSQLLQFASKIAPRGLFTTGKGSTAAGLTAAVLREKGTGEYYLEAGAMVLGDMGVVCIDEIDKMRDEDRVAIHEALEQQTVSISKAGIHAVLNARATVIAAGNPRYGRYIEERTIQDNINLPVTILSRFDLIFILKDIPNPDEDRRLAEYIATVHASFEDVKSPIDPEMLRKYIIYAKKYVYPKLTEEARKILTEFFVEMRRTAAESRDAPIAITARQLEALIRLAEAHARMALKEVVTEEDAIEAIRLMKTMLENVGLDIESGTVDIDTIMTGKPKSRREKILFIEDIIRELSSQSKIGCARLKDIMERARSENIDEETVERIIYQLKQEGVLYEKVSGCFSRVKTY